MDVVGTLCGAVLGRMRSLWFNSSGLSCKTAVAKNSFAKKIQVQGKMEAQRYLPSSVQQLRLSL